MIIFELSIIMFLISGMERSGWSFTDQFWCENICSLQRYREIYFYLGLWDSLIIPM